MFRTWSSLPSRERANQLEIMLTDPSQRHYLELSALVGTDSYAAEIISDPELPPDMKVSVVKNLFSEFPLETSAWLNECTHENTLDKLDVNPSLTHGLLAFRLGMQADSFERAIAAGMLQPDNVAVDQRGGRMCTFDMFCASAFATGFSQLSNDAALLRLEAVLLLYTDIPGLAHSMLEDVVGSREAHIFSRARMEEQMLSIVFLGSIAASNRVMCSGLLSSWAVMCRCMADPGLNAMARLRKSVMYTLTLPWNVRHIIAVAMMCCGGANVHDIARFGEELYYFFVYFIYAHPDALPGNLGCRTVLKLSEMVGPEYANLTIDHMAATVVRRNVHHLDRKLIGPTASLLKRALAGEEFVTEQCLQRRSLTLRLWSKMATDLVSNPAVAFRTDVVVDIVALLCELRWPKQLTLDVFQSINSARVTHYCLGRLDTRPPTWALQAAGKPLPPPPNAPKDPISGDVIHMPAVLLQSLHNHLGTVNCTASERLQLRAHCTAGTTAADLPESVRRPLNAYLLQPTRVVQYEIILRSLRDNATNPYTREPLTIDEFIEMQSWPLARDKLSKYYVKIGCDDGSTAPAVPPSEQSIGRRH